MEFPVDSGRRAKVELGDWATAEARVALLGDSTLDNVLWVGSEPCIPELLAAAVPCAVRNLAADGFNSTDALQGSAQVISAGLRKDVGDPVPFGTDRVFRPLDRLAELSPPPTHVVLSVGGNDVREILGNIGRLPAIMASFAENYPALVEACLAVTPNVILMWQYKPSLDQDGCYGVYRAIGKLPGPGDAVDKLNHLMEEIYQPMVALAREHKLPVVDLPRTFDINDGELYRSQIEPSGKGGAVISALLRHVISCHQSDTPSTFYRLIPCEPEAGEVVEEVNDGQRWSFDG